MADTILGANGTIYQVQTDSQAVQQALAALQRSTAREIIVNVNAGPINWNTLPATATVILTGTNKTDLLIDVPAQFRGSIVNATTGKGTVTVLGNSGNFALISGDNPTDLLVQSNPGSLASFTLGSGNDLLDISGSGRFVFNGSGGNDTVSSTAGQATINPGTGRSEITLGSTNALIDVTGRDTIAAGSGADTIDVSGNGQADVIASAARLDFIGGSHASTVLGGGGRDTIFSGSGGGYFRGGAQGGNVFNVGAGAATLIGGTGADTFSAGSGTASMTGGGGNDKYIFAASNTGQGTNVTITDFSVGHDKIDLVGFGNNAIADVLQTAKNVHGSEVLQLANGATIRLAGVTGLTSSSFTGGSSGSGHDHDSWPIHFGDH